MWLVTKNHSFHMKMWQKFDHSFHMKMWLVTAS